MIRTFDKRYRGEHPMIDPSNRCDECNDVIPERDEVFEYGKDYICRKCWERHLDEAEFYLGPE